MKLDPVKGVLSVDFETTSAADLKALGQWAYAMHESTAIYCAVFGYAETATGPRRRFDWEPDWGVPLPDEVLEFIAAGGRLLAHNASFEISIWEVLLKTAFGWPDVELEQWLDTQVLGMAINLPMTLAGLAKSLGCKVQKDEEGAKLMRLMAKQEPDGFGGWECKLDTPENRKRLLAYCGVDVDATLDAYFKLAPLGRVEALVHQADQRINNRGVFLDVEFARACAAIVDQRKGELDGEILELPTMEIADARNPAALKKFLKGRGVTIPTMTRKKKVDGVFKFRKSETTDKAAIAVMLADPLLDSMARTVLENRQESTKVTSLAKLARVPNMVGRDGRLRFALQYCGAHTGRWTSSGLQVHNLPKDKLGPLADPVRHAIERRDLEGLKFLARRPLEAVSQSLRSIIAAPPGRELIAADYSAIEARVVAWLAGQDDILDLFRDGVDVYVYAATNVGSSDRQLGKVCVLALGYGMGVVTFVTTAAGWGVPLTLKDARRIQRAWRKSNDKIVEYWHVLEATAKKAIQNRGEVFWAGPIKCIASTGCLGIVLPSGRVLRYWKPSIVTAKKTIKMVDEEGAIFEKEPESQEIRFYTMAKDKSSMEVESTYGGKLVENVTQAVARDLLAEASERVDRVAPYDVVMHVHDSLAAEVPEGLGDVEEFCKLISELPAWAKGLPLEAEGYRDVRFRG